MIVIDVLLFEIFHFQWIQIDIQGEKVEWKIFHLNQIEEFWWFKELFARKSSFRPKAWIIFFISFFSIHRDKFFEGFEILRGWREEDNDLVVVLLDHHGFEWSDSSFTCHYTMLLKKFTIRYQINWYSGRRLQQDELFTRNLNKL